MLQQNLSSVNKQEGWPYWSQTVRSRLEETNKFVNREGNNNSGIGIKAVHIRLLISNQQAGSVKRRHYRYKRFPPISKGRVGHLVQPRGTFGKRACELLSVAAYVMLFMELISVIVPLLLFSVVFLVYAAIFSYVRTSRFASSFLSHRFWFGNLYCSL